MTTRIAGAIFSIKIIFIIRLIVSEFKKNNY